MGELSVKSKSIVNIVRRFISTKVKEEDYQTSINSFPSEILQYILQFLPGRQVFRCREVCVRWKQIIDDLVQLDEFWREICTRDYDFIYKQAVLQSNPGLSWCNLYLSLFLWPKLKFTKETWCELPQTASEGLVSTLHAWKGTAAVHNIHSVVYYDLETLEQIDKVRIHEYMLLEENDDVMVYLEYRSRSLHWFRDLVIVPKVNQKLVFDKMVVKDCVNNFIIFKNKVYYNQWKRDLTNSYKVITEMYICDVRNGLKCSFLQRLKESVWAFGRTENSLSYISSNRQIFTMVDGEFVLSESFMYRNDDLFYTLCRHNLTERANFRDWIMDNESITSTIPYLRDTIRVYGDIVFVGSHDGLLKIYNRTALYSNKNAKPLKKYNLEKLFGLTDTEINGIDVMEIENGHVILVSTPSKVMMLSLYHNTF